MKEITSRKTKKVQFVTDEEWLLIREKGWGDRFSVKDVPERKFNVPVLPPKKKEPVTKSKKKND